MISTEIQQVSKTKILVSPDSTGSRQLIIYSNYINNISESNAMVLPVPLPHTIKFINLSEYSDLFDDCAKCFYNPSRSKSLNWSTNSFNTREDNSPLEVFNVGSYQVSMAMNLDQISRVDQKIFVLSPGLKQTLSMFYYQPYWGFIICKLGSGPELYHPFGYSHEIIDNKIYIPTRHYHQQPKWTDVNSWALGMPIDPKQNPLNMLNWNSDNIDNSPMFRIEQFDKTTADTYGWMNQTNNKYAKKSSYNMKSEPEPESEFDSISNSNSIAKMSSRINNLKKLNEQNHNYNNNSLNAINLYKDIADDWSHSIYLLNLNPYNNEQIKQMDTNKEIWNKKILFDPDKIDFNFGYWKSFVKLQIDGIYPNIDLVIPIAI